MKKTTYITIIILFLLSFSSFGQRESEFNQPKKKTFEKTGFGNNSGTEKTGPPDPSGGGTGNPIPISGGLLLLSAGLILHSLNRKNTKKDA